MPIESFRKYNLLSLLVSKASGISTIMKYNSELLYWKYKKLREKELTNWHYEYFFTDYFKIEKDWYKGKKVLDIGCGPRGSLEWVSDIADEAIGLDPLSDNYLKLGAINHKMKYVNSSSENIPYPDNYFHIVSSFNSLDHVDDIDSTISEIKRVLKPEGYFLLISDIHPKPTITEPSAFSWNVTEKLKPELNIVKETHFEGHKMYKSIRAGIPFDHKNISPRYGVLTLLAIKQLADR